MVTVFSELDFLKVQNAQLIFELNMQKLQAQADQFDKIRTDVIRSICTPYVPEGKTLEDFDINLEEKGLVLKTAGVTDTLTE